MGIESYRVDIITDAAGACTAKTQMPVNGKIEQIYYTPDPSTPLATGADIVVTGDSSGMAIVSKLNIGTAAFALAPRQPTHAVADGSAATYDGTRPVLDKIALAGEKIKFVVAQGGNTLSGRFDIVVSDD
jgi:hypothetical protein